MDVIQKWSQYHLRYLHMVPQFILLLQNQGIQNKTWSKIILIHLSATQIRVFDKTDDSFVAQEILTHSTKQ